MVEKDMETFCPTSQQHWRAWLNTHHAHKQSVWLIYHKKKSGKSTLTWSEAVDEALCFGWIDSQAKPIDDNTYRQFFCRRKPNSVWSKINKEKVQQLIDRGLMTQAGLRSIAIAQQNGSWTILDEVEAGIIPADLDEAFQKEPGAKNYFLGLSRSDRRTLLQWLVLAKRSVTRQQRIDTIVAQATQPVQPKTTQWAKIQSGATEIQRVTNRILTK
ncbi:MAG: YdeI/OmpD-associated family protein [Bacteroidetes bacterium]|nr:YdeI/OmpD-associated family protein [Fibrella sp.]